MATNTELLARMAAATPHGVAVMGDFFVEPAEGALLFDVQSRRCIDFAGGIAVMSVGHGHPAVKAAVQAQLERLTHSCWQVAPHEGHVSLAGKLNQLTPGTHARNTAFFSTGAEAVENTIKIARAHTRRSGVIAFSGAFHGRSLFAVSLTGKVQPYKAGFGPFAPEVYHAPFPCHCTPLADVQTAVQQIFKTGIKPARVAAFIFEPVQGEGGFNAIEPAALKWLRALCDEHGIVLIADEIQAQLGQQLQDALNSWRSELPEIHDVRGLGAMVAVELRDPHTQAPLAERVNRVQAHALEHGLLLLSCGMDGHVLRFLFPLTIDEPLFDECLAILRTALLASGV